MHVSPTTTIRALAALVLCSQILAVSRPMHAAGTDCETLASWARAEFADSAPSLDELAAFDRPFGVCHRRLQIRYDNSAGIADHRLKQ